MALRGTAGLALGLVVLTTGCGGSSPKTAAQQSATPSSSPSAVETEGVPGGIAPGVPALNGASVNGTYKSFPYAVGPYSGPTSVTSYQSAGISGKTHDAPSGSSFLLFWVKFANPAADRQEPFPVEIDGELPLSMFAVGVPDAQGHAFGCEAGRLAASAVPDKGYCGYLGFLTSATVGASTDNEIAPSGVIAVQLAIGPVPAGAPLDKLKVYFQGCEAGSAGCTFQGYLEVPLSS